jgi:pSer/pThr/pTyr-binding forkhead associated (FHA) protein
VARLIIFDDHVRGVDLPNSPVIIGRSRKSDVPIHDDILSRKHCALLPDGAGYRLVDLGSANGTFVNGERIEKADLSFDDIVEIGNTVLVFLDTEVWKPGEGLARLRHPVKAQELVHRLKAHVEREKRIPVKRVPRKKPASRRRRDLIQSMPELADSTLGAGEGRPRAQAGLVDLLVDYSVHRTIALLVRNHPRTSRRRWWSSSPATRRSCDRGCAGAWSRSSAAGASAQETPRTDRRRRPAKNPAQRQAPLRREAPPTPPPMPRVVHEGR